MAAIFGVRVEAYFLAPSSPLMLSIDNKRSTTPADRGDYKGSVADQKNMRRDKNSDDDNGSRHGTANKNKKRKRAYG